MNRLKISIAVSTALLLSPCAFSVETEGGITGESSFYNAREEGWFWYKQEPEPEELEEVPVQQPVVVAAQPEQPKEEPKKEEPKKEEEKPVVIAESSGADKPSIPVGSVEWIKVNLQNYRRMALDNPNYENLRAYMYMQRIALDRAEEFAHAGQMVVHGDPFLDEAARGPIAGGLTVKQREYQKHENAEALKYLFKNVGLFYVFKDKCEMCDEQAKVMQVAQRWYDIPIQAVSLDQPSDESLTAKIFPEYFVNPNIINQLKIYAVPSTFAIDSKGQITPIVQGVLTLGDLGSRVIEKAIEKKWLPQSIIAKLRPDTDSTSLSSILQEGNSFTTSLENVATENPYDKDAIKQNFIEPSVLVEMIRKEKERAFNPDRLLQ